MSRQQVPEIEIRTDILVFKEDKKHNRQYQEDFEIDEYQLDRVNQEDVMGFAEIREHEQNRQDAMTTTLAQIDT